MSSKMQDAAQHPPLDMSAVEVIAPNFKRRLSGVTSTIVQLVPLQAKTHAMATLGPGLPPSLPKIRWWQVPGLLRRPKSRPFRIWHARRNPEMLAGLVLKHVFRAPLRLVFTSASQRHHTRYTKWLIRRMDAVVATSRKSGSYLRVPHDVIMHGIDTARFAPPADRQAAIQAVKLDPAQRYIGCFGRVRHQKGTDLFVDTMIAVLPQNPGWSAIVAGRATHEHQEFEAGLKQKAAEAGLADRIHFVGEQQEITPWYKTLSLFVAPQRWEGFGLTPLEAMATRVPVVATDVGAFSELIEQGVTGEVVPRDDLAALIKAVGEWLEDDNMLEKAAQASLRHTQENFPLEREANALNAVYEQLWNGKPA